MSRRVAARFAGLALVAYATRAEAQAVTSPEPITRVEAEYPKSAGATGEHREVELFVTVDQDGRVADAEVAMSAGPEFYAAAIAAVKKWKFRPSLRNGRPVASKIRVAFHF